MLMRARTFCAREIFSRASRQFLWPFLTILHRWFSKAAHHLDSLSKVMDKWSFAYLRMPLSPKLLQVWTYCKHKKCSFLCVLSHARVSYHENLLCVRHITPCERESNCGGHVASWWGFLADNTYPRVLGWHVHHLWAVSPSHLNSAWSEAAV